MGNERFDQLAAGSTEGFRAAKVCCVRFDQSRVEVVLANQQAKLVP